MKSFVVEFLVYVSKDKRKIYISEIMPKALLKTGLNKTFLVNLQLNLLSLSNSSSF